VVVNWCSFRSGDTVQGLQRRMRCSAISDADLCSASYWATVCSSCACLCDAFRVQWSQESARPLGVDRGACCWNFFRLSTAGMGVFASLPHGRSQLRLSGLGRDCCRRRFAAPPSTGAMSLFETGPGTFWHPPASGTKTTNQHQEGDIIMKELSTYFRAGPLWA